MTIDSLSGYLDCFTFGSRPRRIFYAVILEGLFLLGVLSFTPEGLLDTGIVPRFSQVLTLIAIVLTVGTYLISRSASIDSLSPILHTPFVPMMIAAGYLILGLVATSIGYFLHAWIFNISLTPGSGEITIGVRLGLIFGFLILFYYDRYEIEMPGNHFEFREASSGLLEDYRSLAESEEPPIRLTGEYKSLENSVREVASVLEQSTTKDGISLSREMNRWADEFSAKPEPAKGRVVGCSEMAGQEELKDLQQQFKSMIERIRRLGDHE